jgi:hypothetical protein
MPGSKSFFILSILTSLLIKSNEFSLSPVELILSFIVLINIFYFFVIDGRIYIIHCCVTHFYWNKKISRFILFILSPFRGLGLLLHSYTFCTSCSNSLLHKTRNQMLFLGNFNPILLPCSSALFLTQHIFVFKHNDRRGKKTNNMNYQNCCSL